MAIVVQRLTDYRIQMTQEELLRPLAFGSDWNVLRLAVLLQVNGASGVTQTTWPLFALGLAAGNYGYLNNNINSNIIGAGPTQTFATATWAYASGYITASQSGFTSLARLGNTSSNVPIAGTAVPFLSSVAATAGSTPARAPVFVDFVRSNIITNAISPIQVYMWTPSAVQVVVDVTPAVFFDRVQTLAAPTGLTSMLAAGCALPVTAMSAWDTAFFSWPYNAPTASLVEISAFAAVRFA